MNLPPRLHPMRRRFCELVGIGRFSRPAQNDLDAKLARHLTWRKGIFVEAGANDGFSQSNTYFLEKLRGWRGLLVEAIPTLYEQARRCRPRSRVVNCALVPFSREGEDVELIYGNLMSVVSGAMGSPEADAAHIRKAKEHDPSAGSFRVRVKGRALSSLIDESKLERIDFLSLDVEGFEAQVLQGLDLSRHRPKLICVEARNRSAIESLLHPKYEAIEQLTTMDVLYRVRT